jgi:DNA-binding MarR family transcriptional regulator
MSRGMSEPAREDRYVGVIALFRRTAQLMVDELVERIDEAGFPGMSAAHHPVFENIDRHGTRLTDLAARSAMTHQSMSELVAVLEGRGYLERRPDPSDGRARLICLTAEGTRLLRSTIIELQAIEAKWQSRWRRAGYRGDLRRVLEDALAAGDSARTTPNHRTGA